MSRTKHRTLLAATGALLLAAVIYGIGVLKPFGERPAANVRPIRSIAVLPLDDFSGDPNQEYFADGMTDELTTDLASISALRVISRSSVMQYKGAHRPPAPEIAKALNVDGLIEGSVLRIGDRVRITAQLIDAPADRHLWARSYERTSRDVLALQDELAAAIASEINVQLTPQEDARLTSSRPVNPEAYDAYLQGRYLLNAPTTQNLEKALAEFEHAIQLDPSFAPAFAGLAVVYTWEAWGWGAVGDTTPTLASAKSKAGAEKALQLDNTLAEAHCALGVALENFFDWTGAENELRSAIALNPSYAYAHSQYGIMLAQLGRLDQALVENMRAVELDPLSPENRLGWAIALVWQGNYQGAMEQLHRAGGLDPDGAHWAIGWTNIQSGKLSQAIPEARKAYALDPTALAAAALLGYAYAASGDRTGAMALLDKLQQESSRRFVSPGWSAMIYIGLGDRQRALEALGKAYEAHDPTLMQIKMDKIYKPLRSDPQFIELLRKMHLDK